MLKGLGSFLLPRIKGITDSLQGLLGGGQRQPTTTPEPQITAMPNAPLPNDPMYNRRTPKVEIPQRIKSSPTPSTVPTPSPVPTNVLGAQSPTPSSVTGMVTKGRNPAFKTVRATQDVVEAINKAANTYKIPAELLFDIGLQESSLYPKKVNPNAAVGLNPSGLYQFTDETWRSILDRYNDKPGMSLKLPNTDRFDPNTNALAAAYLIKNGQLGKWDASEDVWGNFWTPQELEQMGFYKQSLHHNPGERSSVRLTGGKKK